MCLFLALAKRFNDGNTIVVLDDVLTSVDQVHTGRFMNMLHDAAADFSQLIITTHYRPWRDRYKYARGPAGNVQLIELLHWSLPRGIRHARTKLSVEELQDYLWKEPLDRQIVSSKAGILLESILDHVALLYECSLPRRPEPEYTLGDLIDCIGGKLRKVLRVEMMRQDADNWVMESEVWLAPVLSTLAGITWIRNQVGCHWNTAGQEVGEPEVQEFTRTTIQLAEILICGNCGEMPRTEKDGAYRKCRCGGKRLYPMDNPQ